MVNNCGNVISISLHSPAFLGNPGAPRWPILFTCRRACRRTPRSPPFSSGHPTSPPASPSARHHPPSPPPPRSHGAAIFAISYLMSTMSPSTDPLRYFSSSFSQLLSLLPRSPLCRRRLVCSVRAGAAMENMAVSGDRMLVVNFCYYWIVVIIC